MPRGAHQVDLEGTPSPARGERDFHSSSPPQNDEGHRLARDGPRPRFAARGHVASLRAGVRRRRPRRALVRPHAAAAGGLRRRARRAPQPTCGGAAPPAAHVAARADAPHATGGTSTSTSRRPRSAGVGRRGADDVADIFPRGRHLPQPRVESRARRLRAPGAAGAAARRSSGARRWPRPARAGRDRCCTSCPRTRTRAARARARRAPRPRRARGGTTCPSSPTRSITCSTATRARRCAPARGAHGVLRPGFPRPPTASRPRRLALELHRDLPGARLGGPRPRPR